MSKTKGILFWKKVWGSPCSRHREKTDGYNICAAGKWTNAWSIGVNQLLWRISPRLWKWYMNRPNSKARKELEEMFPNLRKNK